MIRRQSDAYLSDIRVTNFSKSFTHKMAAGTNWHRCETKLRHCHCHCILLHPHSDFDVARRHPSRPRSPRVSAVFYHHIFSVQFLIIRGKSKITLYWSLNKSGQNCVPNWLITQFKKMTLHLLINVWKHRNWYRPNLNALPWINVLITNKASPR